MVTSTSRPRAATARTTDPSTWQEALAAPPRSRREARERQAAAAVEAATPRCGCGTAWAPGRDRCTFCGELRRSGLAGVLGWTGRHWLSGPRRDPR